jgi:uncharacterized protein YkwD
LKAWLALVAGIIAALPALTEADSLSAVNYDRMHGCGPAGAQSALQASTKLRLAASRVADGASLQQAIAAVGYLAAQSSAIHISGPVSDADIEHLIAAHYCRTVQDPQMREFGAEQRGHDVWMIVAAPMVLPALGDAAAVQRRILDLVNEARAMGRRCGSTYFAPTGALTLDAALSRAALEHSRDMASHDEFDHRGHDGSTPALRVQRAGFTNPRVVGENIAAGAMTPAEVTQGWLASPAHCENIMDQRFTFMGSAYAEDLHTHSAIFWTQDFAARR